uniref:NADH-ubiquinone oxidoreductase chain 1 n=1 Tax=Catharus ustulatus TaxID=91951 RepID=A0A8C3TJB4_CATUS
MHSLVTVFFLHFFLGEKFFRVLVQIPSLASPPANFNDPLLINLIIALSYAPLILFAVAFPTPAECKILSYIQGQKGPNIIGLSGLLQPLEDGAKLFIKEPICPSTSSPVLLITTPISTPV